MHLQRYAIALTDQIFEMEKQFVKQLKEQMAL